MKFTLIIAPTKFNNLQLAQDIDSTCNIPCHKINDSEVIDQEIYRNKNLKGRQFNIISQNIRSVNKNLDSLLIYLTRFKTYFDILVLSECWCDASSIPPIIDGYNMHFTKKSYNQNDGVIMYIKADIDATVTEIDLENSNCLAARIGNTTVLGIYRPHCFENPQTFIDSLDRNLTTIRSRNVVLTGDINIDLLQTNDKYTMDYTEILASHGLVPAVTIPTHGRTCLDHVMIKLAGRARCFVSDTDITDHSSIILSLAGSPTDKSEPIRLLTRTKTDYDSIGKALQEYDWAEFLNINDANEAAETIMTLLKNLIAENTTTVTYARKRKPLKPWITSNIIRCFHKRDRLHLQLRKDPNNIILRAQYRAYRNTCNDTAKNLRTMYYKNKLQTSVGNSGETWRTIKEICNLPTQKSSATSLLNLADTPKESLNIVNKYFTSVGSDLANEILRKIDTTDTKLVASQPLGDNAFSITLHPTDYIEVDKIIAGSKTRSAPGADTISSNLLKKFRRVLCFPIAHMCNLSLATGVFPAVFKDALVTPIHKAGSRDTVSNYRPISLLSTISKILEKVVNGRLTSYLEKNNLLASNQFGFRTGKSTEDAVATLSKLITEKLDRGQKCLGIFLDLQKAFDTVSIPLLLKKLENMGVRGTPLDWFTDYLMNRQQVTKVLDNSSNKAKVKYGIPQGSTLGPTLFLIYANSLCKLELENGQSLAFADDTALIFYGSTWESVKETAEKGLMAVTRWLEDNLLTINVPKTKYICFRITNANKPTSNFNITVHTYPCNRQINSSDNCSCKKLEQTSNIKYLGVIIDEKLNWQPQIKALSNRTRRLIPIFKNLRDVADKNLLLTVYTALCQSLLCYCIPIWGGAAATHLIELERAQRMVIKIMFRKRRRFPTELLYKETKILTVRQLYIQNTILRFHKHNPPKPSEPTRRRRRVPITRVKTTFASHQYTFRGPILYKKLNNIKDIPKLSKYCLKKILKCKLNELNYDSTEKFLNPLS